MSQGNEKSLVGKKKRQRLMEGAGFLLSMLRQSNDNDTLTKEDDAPAMKHGTSQENFINDDNIDSIEQFSSNFDNELDKSSDFIESEEAVCFSQTEPLQEPNEESSKDNLIIAPSCSDDIVKVEVFVPAFRYDFKRAPTELLSEYKEFASSASDRNNFLKGCKWSPDGCSLLTNSDDRILRIFTLPDEFYDSNFDCDTSKRLKMMSKITNGEIVYDFCWYPFVSHPNTHCTMIASTCRDHPIHLWDVAENKIQSTFTAINHLDELATAHSLAFSLDGRKLYSGYKNCIRVFDFCRPGRQIETKDTRGDKNLRSLSVGQNGIVSCFAMCPTYPGVYICGSYSRTLALYSDELKSPQCVFQGHSGGITHVAYHPNGNFVYSGARKDNEIICWDMRNLGAVLHTFERFVDTNQRIYFEIDKSGRYLASGNCNGEINVWDLENSNELTKFTSNKSCVNGISFNPFLPLMASSSGQRTFDETGFDTETFEKSVKNKKNDVKFSENCIKLWKTNTVVE